MNEQTKGFWLSIVLVVYLLGIGIFAIALLVINFPIEGNGGVEFPHGENNTPVLYPFGPLGSVDQGLLFIAVFAGITGSFIHAAQSLSSYIGNREFEPSWTAWYILRPWIGGVLGFTIYFVLRAGLIAGPGSINPYGVVAIGLLGGWFSKTTTDKLQEVFETLFRTNVDEKRKDKLTGSGRPLANK